MKTDIRIKFVGGKAHEFIKRLAEDADFRRAVESDPRRALVGYVVSIDEVPAGPVQLPPAEEIAKQSKTILEKWEDDCFVGHWPFLYR